MAQGPGSAPNDDALAAARARWPQVGLDAADFVAWLRGRGLAPGQLSAERVADLFIVCACLRNAPGAHAAFDAQFAAGMRRAVSRMKNGPPVEDVLQKVRLRLFAATEQRNAKLDEYTADGELASWLRTVVLRVALTMQSRRKEEEIAPQAIDGLVARLADPEQQALKAQNSEVLKRAFAAALGTLEPRQRTLLKLSVLDGLSIDQIAPLYQVHRATAARWLTAIRGELQSATLAELRRTLGLTSADVESLLGQLNSHVQLSLDRLLKTRD